MDAQALATEAEVLSAHYSIDTIVNLHPRTRPNTQGSEAEGANGTVPTLSPPVLAFLAARRVASQTQTCPFRRADLALDPYVSSRNGLHRTSSH